jgi:hypothetical protein
MEEHFKTFGAEVPGVHCQMCEDWDHTNCYNRWCYESYLDLVGKSR